MSLQGWVTAVTSAPIGTALAADAAAASTSLTVDYAGDFDPEGGQLSMAGQVLEYSGFTPGVEDDDPDVIHLVGATGAAVAEDTPVTVMIAGRLASEMVALVSLGDGGIVQIPVPFEQRALWEPRSYDPPLPCTVADDLMRIEGTYGLQPTLQVGSALKFWVDRRTATEPGDMTIPLTYMPLFQSPDVKCNGLGQPGTWAQSGQTILVSDPLDEIRAGDVFTVEYAYQDDPSNIGAFSYPEAFIGTSSASGATSLALNYPTGTEPGDLLILWTVSANAPAGWTAHATVTVPRASSGSAAFTCLSRMAGSETSVALTHDGSTYLGGVMAAIRGAQVADFSSNGPTGSASSSYAVPALTGGGWNILCIADNANSPNPQLPGWDESVSPVAQGTGTLAHGLSDGDPQTATLASGTAKWGSVTVKVVGA